tara:strand:+ start:452 stop:2008 length:1557 start_codon:yes stop_codon:yes gene_type:complete
MPIMIGRNNPNSYRIESITISNNEGNSYDVSNIFESFEITESIYQMFLTGSITILDGTNLFNRIGFTGQEYIRIHICGIQGDEEKVPYSQHIDQVFRIFNVSQIVRPIENPKLSAYKLEFCSPLLYEARTQRISQCYRGKTGDILNKICVDKLKFKKARIDATNYAKPLKSGGKELGNFFTVFEAGVGEDSGVVIPNWSVFKALRWLRDHTSNDSERPYGDSYYLYQTALGGFRFNNIESMRKLEYLNGKVKFAPRMGAGDDSFNYDFEGGVGNDILAFSVYDNHNVVNSHQEGTYGAHVQSYNTLSKMFTDFESEFTHQFEVDDEGNYKKKGIMGGKATTFADAPPFRIGDEHIIIPPDGGTPGAPLDKGVAVTEFEKGTKNSIVHKSGSSVVFNYNTPYTMSQGPQSDGNNATFNNIESTRMNRDRVEQLLKNNRINIQISGRTNISCGMTINVDIKQPTRTSTVLDAFTHNGSLLVEGITWRGTENGLETQLSCSTDGHLVPMDTFINHDLYPQD